MRPFSLFAASWPEFHSYGILITLGLWCTVPFVVWDLQARKISRILAFDLYLVLIVGAVLGARLGFVATKPAAFIANPAQILAIGDGGQVFFAGVLGCALAAIVLARWRKLALSSICDIVLTWGALGHAFGRLGCFSVGCCYGAPTKGDLGVRFGPDAIVAGDPQLWIGTTTLPIHPVQLYEALGLLLIFVAQWQWRVRTPMPPAWHASARWAVAYGALRFVVECFRGDAVRGRVVSWPLEPINRLIAVEHDHPTLLSVAQLTSLALILVGASVLLRQRKSPTSAPPVVPAARDGHS